jgi:hypothetical protein
MGAELEGTREAGSVADAARGEHRQRLERAGGSGQELPDRGRAADVAAGLHALDDHRVDATLTPAR